MKTPVFLYLLIFVTIAVQSFAGVETQAEPHTRQVIERVYRELLNRTPDENGLETYVVEMQENGKDEAWLRTVIIKSDEYRNLCAERQRLFHQKLKMGLIYGTATACFAFFLFLLIQGVKDLQKTSSAFSGMVVRLENRIGINLTGYIIGFFLLAVAAFLVMPSMQPRHWGGLFQQLSTNPFDFQGGNPMQMRILTPLLAYICHFRGAIYIAFPLVTAVLFMGTAYAFFRRQHFAAWTSFMITGILAFSTPVLHVLHFAGYADITTYFLIGLCLITKRQPLRLLFFSMALLNHESSAFCLPFLILNPLDGKISMKKLLRNLLWLIPAFIPLTAYRHYVQSFGEQYFASSYYLNKTRVIGSVKCIYGLFPLGVFGAFRLFWLFFIYATIVLFQQKRHRENCWIWLVIVCALVQLFIATDTTRLLGLAFPAILYSTYVVSRALPDRIFQQILFVVTLFTLFIPAYYIGQFYLTPYYSMPMDFVIRLCGVDSWELWWRIVN